MGLQDTEKVKDIPGFKVILRAVIKSQICMLTDLLRDQVQDECCLLIASPGEGSHVEIGTRSGQQFLEANNVSGKFLEFCLKRQHSSLPQDILKTVDPYLKQDSENHGQSSSDPYLSFSLATPPLPGHKQHQRSAGVRSSPYPRGRRDGAKSFLPCAALSGHIGQSKDNKHASKELEENSVDNDSSIVIKTEPVDIDDVCHDIPDAMEATNIPVKFHFKKRKSSKASQKSNSLDNDHSLPVIFPVIPNHGPTSGTSTVDAPTANDNQDAAGAMLSDPTLVDSSEMLVHSKIAETASVKQKLVDAENCGESGSSGMERDPLSGGVSSNTTPDSSSVKNIPAISSVASNTTTPRLSPENNTPGLSSVTSSNTTPRQSHEKALAGRLPGGSSARTPDVSYVKTEPLVLGLGCSSNTHSLSPDTAFPDSPGQRVSIDGRLVVLGDEPVRVHQCEFCSKPFPSKWELARHRRTHTGEKPFICHVCQKPFSDKSNMVQHLKGVHLKVKYRPDRAFTSYDSYHTDGGWRQQISVFDDNGDMVLENIEDQSSNDVDAHQALLDLSVTAADIKPQELVKSCGKKRGASNRKCKKGLFLENMDENVVMHSEDQSVD